jgi:hypothetical protein
MPARGGRWLRSLENRLEAIEHVMPNFIDNPENRNESMRLEG